MLRKSILENTVIAKSGASVERYSLRHHRCNPEFISHTLDRFAGSRRRRMMKYTVSYGAILVAFFFTAPLVASASQLYLETTPTAVNVGDTITATLFLDTQGDGINALEGSVSFSQNLSFVQISHGNSLVALWMRPPEVSGDTISYAGIVPGGYRGEVGPKWVGYRPGRVFSMVFQANATGDAWIQVNRESVVLLNDGRATEASLTVKDVALAVTAGKSTADIIPVVPSWNDTIPPESFTPLTIRNPDTFFSGTYYLIFETTDKDSGVSYYEVEEGDGIFNKATSPYLLQNQRRDTSITVRAIDRAGNIRDVIVLPVAQEPWYVSYRTFGIVFFCIVLVAIVGIIKRKRMYVKKEEQEQEQEQEQEHDVA